jgi:hypothetical protein
MRKILAATSAALTAGVLAPTAVVTHTYIVRPRQVQGWGLEFTGKSRVFLSNRPGVALAFGENYDRIRNR